jgi:hypothetical protein
MTLNFLNVRVWSFVYESRFYLYHMFFGVAWVAFIMARNRYMVSVCGLTSRGKRRACIAHAESCEEINIRHYLED